jgi:hypothetical protein
LHNDGVVRQQIKDIKPTKTSPGGK